MSESKRGMSRSRSSNRLLAIIAAMAFAAGALYASATIAKQMKRSLDSENEQRVALIIGNSAYREAPLANPANDAADMAKALTAMGFKVTLKINANRRQMEESIRNLGTALRQGGVGFFYYAGHGIQSKGANYLVPLAANIQSEADLRYETVDANMVLSQMEEAGNRVNIVVLDACRNNPLARSFRSAAQGLAQMEAAKGSFIAFATSPGSVASDGAGRNGTYTKHLLASLNQGDSDIDKVFRRVAAAVSNESRGKQVPWTSSSLTGDFYFSSRAAEVPPAVSSALGRADAEIVFWESIRNSNSVADYKAYLQQYPKGRFVALARVRAQDTKLAAAAPSRPVVPATVELSSRLGEKLKEIDGSEMAAFSKDGNRVLLAKGYKISVVDMPFLTETTFLDWNGKGSLARALFSPDGRYVLSGDHYSVCTLFDVASKKQVWRHPAGEIGQAIIAISPDGKLALCGIAENLVWFDLESGRELRRVKTQHSTLQSLAFSPDGKQFASAGYSGFATLWDTVTGTELKRTTNEGTSHAVAFTPDGSSLVVGYDDKVVRVWDIATMTERRFAGHAGSVFSVAVSPDGRYLLSGGSTDNTVILWDIVNGRELKRLTGETHRVYWTAFSPDGKYALTSGIGKTFLWRIAD